MNVCARLAQDKILKASLEAILEGDMEMDEKGPQKRISVQVTSPLIESVPGDDGGKGEGAEGSGSDLD